MAYIGVSPQNGVRKKHTYTASGSQTSFTGAGAEGITLSYKDSNFVDVYQNGVKLAEADYTSTTGTTIVLAQGAAANDIVEIIVYDVFSTSDMVSASDGGTFAGNVAMSGTLTLTGNGDFNGDLDVDGTLETDALTINGVTLAETISDTVGAMVSGNTETGITVTYQDGDNTLDFVVGTLNQDTTGTAANATLAATVTVTDSTANTNFPIVFHDESNALLDDTGALRYNPSTGELLVPKLTVAGVTTTADTVTMQAANAVVFEGATADAHETTLTITDPTADRTITLPNVSGTLPILAADSNTAITSTPAEINLLDGSVANTVVNSKAVIYGSSGELAGALSTAAQPNVTSLGTLTALTVDDITINGSTISDGGDLTIDIEGELSLDANGGEIKFKDDGTVFGQIINSSTDLVVQVSTIDKDFIVKGKDDGSTITALTLDMSAAGTATFNHDIKLSADAIIDCGGNLRLDTESASVVFQDTGTVYGKVFQSSSDLVLKSEVNDKDIIFQGFDGGSTVTALTLDMSNQGNAIFNNDIDQPNANSYIKGAGHNIIQTDSTRTYFYGGTNGVQFRTSDNAAENITFSDSGAAVFNEQGNDADFRVESNGYTHTLFVQAGSDKVGIGDSSPNSYNNYASNLVINNGGDSNGHVGMTIACATDKIGSIYFADGTSGNAAYRGAIYYNHSEDRMYILQAGAGSIYIHGTGQVAIGQTTNEATLCIFGHQQSYTGLQIKNGTNNGSTLFAVFKRSNGTAAGSIQQSSDGATTAFNTTSDYRLKESISYDFDATTRLKQLKPCRFVFKESLTGQTVDGFLAHEVSDVVSEAVTGEKDAMKDVSDVVLNSDGTVLSQGVSEEEWIKGKSDKTYASNTTWTSSKSVIDPQGIDQSKLVPLLVKTIQELEARITALESA
jgi:hypothetical protein